MGASQSSNSGSQAQEATSQKTSYYTLLALDRGATEDEIKKAYRKKALELHPDRNYGNVESATTLFAEIQSAYQVLSDPQERAWYDAHESAILRGDDPTTSGGTGGEYEYGNMKMTSSDDLARLLRKFNSNVEFSDAPSGFFGFVRETFEQLAKEEEAAADWEGTDLPDYPSFGHKDDAYEDVPKSFYAVWMSFSTRKSFAWCDQYRLSEAPDRRYRRMMEKENQKARDTAIREFNEAVRALVAFIRKRDPRYIPNTQTEAERQKVLRDAAAAQAARARAANAAIAKESVVPDWAQTVEKDEHEGEIEESEEDEIHYECVACKKVFKSEKQWDAHEKSKKHQKAVFALRKKMQKENAHLNLNSEPTSGDVTPLDVEEQEPLPEDQYPIMEDDAVQGINDLTLEDSASEQGGINDLTLEDSDSEQGDMDHDKEATRPDQGTLETSAASPASSDTSDDEYAPADQVKARLAPSSPSLSTSDKPTPDTVPLDQPAPNTESLNNPAPDSEKPPSNSEDEATTSNLPKMGKAAQKRAKKAAQVAAAASEQDNNDFSCAGCGATFPSKTRMHQHLKDFPKHAALKNVATAGSGGGKRKKGKK